MFMRKTDPVATVIAVADWTDNDFVIMMNRHGEKIQNALTGNVDDADIIGNECTLKAIEFYITYNNKQASYEYYITTAATILYFINEKIQAGLMRKLSTEFIETVTETAIKLSTTIQDKLSLLQQPLMTSMQKYRHGKNHHQISRIFQARTHHELALKHASIAIHSIALSGNWSLENFLDIAEIYAELAVSFNFDITYADLFQFAGDFFTGQRATNLKRFIQLEKPYSERPDPTCIRSDMILQFLRLAQGRCHDPELPDCEFKQELKNSTSSKTIQMIVDKYTAREKQHLYASFAPLKAVQEECKVTRLYAENRLTDFDTALPEPAVAAVPVAPAAPKKNKRFSLKGIFQPASQRKNNEDKDQDKSPGLKK